MSTNYAITIDDDGNGAIVVTEDGQVHTITSDDPRFPAYLDAAIAGRSLAEITTAAPDVTPLTELSERVYVSADRIEFDGEPVHDALARTIQRYWLEGRPYGGLVKFMERLSLNSCEHSRESLWRWVSDRDLEINAQGLIVAYKGVNADLTSVHSGPALVDDVPFEGHVPNQAGSVISMERSKVQHDPNVACGFGLHVGTKGYAQSFGTVLLTVLVDPVDVVSVPTDCGGEKMRCCRYEIIDVHDPSVDYEPTPVDDPAFETIEDRITEAASEEARPFIATMLEKIRRGRRS